MAEWERERERKGGRGGKRYQEGERGLREKGDGGEEAEVGDIKEEGCGKKQM